MLRILSSTTVILALLILAGCCCGCMGGPSPTVTLQSPISTGWQAPAQPVRLAPAWSGANWTAPQLAPAPAFQAPAAAPGCP